MEKNPKIGIYFAAGFTSDRTLNKKEISNIEGARKELTREFLPNSILKEFDTYPMYKERDILTCKPETSIRLAVSLMNEKEVGSILIVDSDKRPVGILTDVDFRKKVIPENIDYTVSVSKIMSSPVQTVKRDISLAESMLIMMKNNIRHLCITEDGTKISKVVGIITEHDVLLLQSNNPAVITKEINQTKKIRDIPPLMKKIEEIIKEYVKQEVSINYILDIISEVNDTLVNKIIEISKFELTLKGFSDPGIDFVWIALGSEGRREQASQTDQDNAILYANPPVDKKDEAKLYFLELGKLVTKGLNECGFSYCRGNIMASNPDLCKSSTEWKESYQKWILSGSPEAILKCSIFFDFRCIYGNATLLEDLEEFIEKKIDENPNLLRFMALNAISNSPPLGFFRNFLLEKSGKHKHEFNLKIRGITPLVDSARVLALKYKIRDKSTTVRFQKLAEKNPELKKIYLESLHTFHILSRFKLVNKFNYPDSDNYLNPDHLSKMERDILKHSFQVILDLQNHLEHNFQLQLMLR